MLRRQDPAAEINAKFACLDIENDKEGNVLAIGVSWREAEIINHRVFLTWDDFWRWLLPQARQSEIFRTIYAHNGGGWDWLSFLQWYCKAKLHEKTSVGLIEAQSKLVFLDVAFMREDLKAKRGERRRLTIRFCDSMYLLRSSLNDLALKIVGQGKTEAKIEDVWWAWKNDKDRFYAYLRSDCDLLLLVLEKSLDLIREKIAKIGKLGITIGSCAMSIYRTIWSHLENPIYNNFPEGVEEFCRAGYHGGRVEVFRHGHYPHINVYDLNSLYPTAMVSTPVPISAKGGWTSRLRLDVPCGVYEICYRQSRTDIPPVLIGANAKGQYSGTGVYYTPEIALLREVDPNALIEVKRGWVFSDSDYIFTEFVERLYRLRLEDKQSAVSLLAKFLLNSLYGKWAQRGEREKLVVFDSAESAFEAELEAAKAGKGLAPIERDSLLYTETETTEVDHAHVGIAGMITSQARVLLYRMILAAGADTVVYTDTDSIHTTSNSLDKFIGPELGKLKLEASGEGVYCGKKLYAIRSGSDVKIRAKGISLKRKEGDFGYDLRFEQLQSLLTGVEVKTEFKRPATFRGVLAGQQSCKLDTVLRTRKLRQT